jgi:hypothetical protein
MPVPASTARPMTSATRTRLAAVARCFIGDLIMVEGDMAWVINDLRGWCVYGRGA